MGCIAVVQVQSIGQLPSIFPLEHSKGVNGPLLACELIVNSLILAQEENLLVLLCTSRPDIFEPHLCWVLHAQLKISSFLM